MSIRRASGLDRGQAAKPLGGGVMPVAALYLDIERRCDGVVRLDTGAGEQLYAIGLGTCGNGRFAWRCESWGFSFLPGLASSNHLQFGQGCAAANTALADERGNLLSSPAPAPERKLRIEARVIAFVADDGGMVRAEW